MRNFSVRKYLKAEIERMKGSEEAKRKSMAKRRTSIRRSTITGIGEKPVRFICVPSDKPLDDGNLSLKTVKENEF